MSTLRTEEIAARAHRSSVTLAPSDLTSALAGKLGPKVVAFIASRDASTIRRWSADEGVTPDEAALRPLRAAYQIVDLLASEESDHTIRAWFIGMNPQLEDLSPAEALRDGKLREALAAARAFHSGG